MTTLTSLEEAIEGGREAVDEEENNIEIFSEKHSALSWFGTCASELVLAIDTIRMAYESED